MNRFVLIAVTSLMMLGGCSPADDIDPAVLLADVAKNYQDMETFESEGTITMKIDSADMKMTTRTTFTMRLKKPDLYLITWTQDIMGMKTPGAVWHDGTQRGLYMGGLNTWSVMKNDQMNIATATGISGGAAQTIPAMFLPAIQGMMDPMALLDDPKVEKAETIDGVECFVVSASSAAFKKATYWISKSDQHIVKYEHTLEPPDGETLEIPEMTDAEIEDTIRGMGEEVTEASIAKMRGMMDQSRTMMATADIKGLSTEQHQNISSPELSDADFSYELPAGAERKDSLFDAVPNFGNEGG